MYLFYFRNQQLVHFFGLVFDWIRANGDVEEMKRRSIVNAETLYKAIDESNGFYVNNVDNQNFEIGLTKGIDLRYSVLSISRKLVLFDTPCYQFIWQNRNFNLLIRGSSLRVIWLIIQIN